MITLGAVAGIITGALNNDATLQGSTYLNGSAKIFPSPNRPPTVSNPCLTLRFIPDLIAGEQGYEWRWLLWVNLYLTNFVDLTPDLARAKRCEERLRILLDQVTLSGDDVPQVIVEHEIIPAQQIPPEDPKSNETIFNFRYKVIAR